MIREERQTGIGYGTATPFSIIYWCGRVERILKDREPLTAEEERKHAEFVKRQEIDPWPECPRCRKAKTRAVAQMAAKG